MHRLFKAETYLGRFLMNYINKYVLLRSDQIAMSLWEGDISLFDLELRYDIFENILPLPIGIQSGHVRQLRVHVPWTKLTSENIVVTLDNVECVLCLKQIEHNRVENVSEPSDPNQQPQQQQGYIQSTLDRLIANIRFVVNNLSFKFTIDDIVLSCSAASLSYFPTTDQWEPTFCSFDTSRSYTVRRKLAISDLTICIDHLTSTQAKPAFVEVYEHPVAYRFALTGFIEVICAPSSSLQNGPSSTTYPVITAIQLHCDHLRLNFSTRQLNALARLLQVIYYAHFGYLDWNYLKSNECNQNDLDGTNPVAQQEQNETQQDWASWMWSLVPAVLPPNEDDVQIDLEIDDSESLCHDSTEQNERHLYELVYSDKLHIQNTVQNKTARGENNFLSKNESQPAFRHASTYPNLTNLSTEDPVATYRSIRKRIKLLGKALKYPRLTILSLFINKISLSILLPSTTWNLDSSHSTKAASNFQSRPQFIPTFGVEVLDLAFQLTSNNSGSFTSVQSSLQSVELYNDTSWPCPCGNSTESPKQNSTNDSDQPPMNHRLMGRIATNDSSGHDRCRDSFFFSTTNHSRQDLATDHLSLPPVGWRDYYARYDSTTTTGQEAVWFDYVYSHHREELKTSFNGTCKLLSRNRRTHTEGLTELAHTRFLISCPLQVDLTLTAMHQLTALTSVLYSYPSYPSCRLPSQSLLPTNVCIDNVASNELPVHNILIKTSSMLANLSTSHEPIGAPTMNPILFQATLANLHLTLDRPMYLLEAGLLHSTRDPPSPFILPTSSADSMIEAHSVIDNCLCKSYLTYIKLDLLVLLSSTSDPPIPLLHIDQGRLVTLTSPPSPFGGDNDKFSSKSLGFSESDLTFTGLQLLTPTPLQFASIVSQLTCLAELLDAGAKGRLFVQPEKGQTTYKPTQQQDASKHLHTGQLIMTLTGPLRLRLVRQQGVTLFNLFISPWLTVELYSTTGRLLLATSRSLRSDHDRQQHQPKESSAKLLSIDLRLPSSLASPQPSGQLTNDLDNRVIVRAELATISVFLVNELDAWLTLICQYTATDISSVNSEVGESIQAGSSVVDNCPKPRDHFDYDQTSSHLDRNTITSNASVNYLLGQDAFAPSQHYICQSTISSSSHSVPKSSTDIDRVWKRLGYKLHQIDQLLPHLQLKIKLFGVDCYINSSPTHFSSTQSESLSLLLQLPITCLTFNNNNQHTSQGGQLADRSSFHLVATNCSLALVGRTCNQSLVCIESVDCRLHDTSSSPARRDLTLAVNMTWAEQTVGTNSYPIHARLTFDEIEQCSHQFNFLYNLVNKIDLTIKACKSTNYDRLSSTSSQNKSPLNSSSWQLIPHPTAQTSPSSVCQSILSNSPPPVRLHLTLDQPLLVIRLEDCHHHLQVAFDRLLVTAWVDQSASRLDLQLCDFIVFSIPHSGCTPLPIFVPYGVFIKSLPHPVDERRRNGCLPHSYIQSNDADWSRNCLTLTWQCSAGEDEDPLSVEESELGVAESRVIFDVKFNSFDLMLWPEVLTSLSDLVLRCSNTLGPRSGHRSFADHTTNTTALSNELLSSITASIGLVRIFLLTDSAITLDSVPPINTNGHNCLVVLVEAVRCDQSLDNCHGNYCDDKVVHLSSLAACTLTLGSSHLIFSTKDELQKFCLARRSKSLCTPDAVDQYPSQAWNLGHLTYTAAPDDCITAPVVFLLKPFDVTIALSTLTYPTVGPSIEVTGFNPLSVDLANISITCLVSLARNFHNRQSTPCQISDRKSQQNSTSRNPFHRLLVTFPLVTLRLSGDSLDRSAVWLVAVDQPHLLVTLERAEVALHDLFLDQVTSNVLDLSTIDKFSQLKVKFNQSSAPLLSTGLAKCDPRTGVIESTFVLKLATARSFGDHEGKKPSRWTATITQTRPILIQITPHSIESCYASLQSFNQAITDVESSSLDSIQSRSDQGDVCVLLHLFNESLKHATLNLDSFQIAFRGNNNSSLANTRIQLTSFPTTRFKARALQSITNLVTVKCDLDIPLFRCNLISPGSDSKEEEIFKLISPLVNTNISLDLNWLPCQHQTSQSHRSAFSYQLAIRLPEAVQLQLPVEGVVCDHLLGLLRQFHSVVGSTKSDDNRYAPAPYCPLCCQPKPEFELDSLRRHYLCSMANTDDNDPFPSPQYRRRPMQLEPLLHHPWPLPGQLVLSDNVKATYQLNAQGRIESPIVTDSSIESHWTGVTWAYAQPCRPLVLRLLPPHLTLQSKECSDDCRIKAEGIELIGYLQYWNPVSGRGGRGQFVTYCQLPIYDSRISEVLMGDDTRTTSSRSTTSTAPSTILRSRLDKEFGSPPSASDFDEYDLRICGLQTRVQESSRSNQSSPVSSIWRLLVDLRLNQPSNSTDLTSTSNLLSSPFLAYISPMTLAGCINIDMMIDPVECIARPSECRLFCSNLCVSTVSRTTTKKKLASNRASPSIGLELARLTVEDIQFAVISQAKFDDLDQSDSLLQKMTLTVANCFVSLADPNWARLLPVTSIERVRGDLSSLNRARLIQLDIHQTRLLLSADRLAALTRVQKFWLQSMASVEQEQEPAFGWRLINKTDQVFVDQLYSNHRIALSFKKSDVFEHIMFINFSLRLTPPFSKQDLCICQYFNLSENSTWPDRPHLIETRIESSCHQIQWRPLWMEKSPSLRLRIAFDSPSPTSSDTEEQCRLLSDIIEISWPPITTTNSSTTFKTIRVYWTSNNALLGIPCRFIIIQPSTVPGLPGTMLFLSNLVLCNRLPVHLHCKQTLTPSKPNLSDKEAGKQSTLPSCTTLSLSTTRDEFTLSPSGLAFYTASKSYDDLLPSDHPIVAPPWSNPHLSLMPTNLARSQSSSSMATTSRRRILKLNHVNQQNELDTTFFGVATVTYVWLGKQECIALVTVSPLFEVFNHLPDPVTITVRPVYPCTNKIDQSSDNVPLPETPWLAEIPPLGGHASNQSDSTAAKPIFTARSSNLILSAKSRGDNELFTEPLLLSPETTLFKLASTFNQLHGEDACQTGIERSPDGEIDLVTSCPRQSLSGLVSRQLSSLLTAEESSMDQSSTFNLSIVISARLSFVNNTGCNLLVAFAINAEDLTSGKHRLQEEELANGSACVVSQKQPLVRVGVASLLDDQLNYRHSSFFLDLTDCFDGTGQKEESTTDNDQHPTIPLLLKPPCSSLLCLPGDNRRLLLLSISIDSTNVQLRPLIELDSSVDLVVKPILSMLPTSPVQDQPVNGHPSSLKKLESSKINCCDLVRVPHSTTPVPVWTLTHDTDVMQDDKTEARRLVGCVLLTANETTDDTVNPHDHHPLWSIPLALFSLTIDQSGRIRCSSPSGCGNQFQMIEVFAPDNTEPVPLLVSTFQLSPSNSVLSANICHLPDALLSQSLSIENRSHRHVRASFLDESTESDCITSSSSVLFSDTRPLLHRRDLHRWLSPSVLYKLFKPSTPSSLGQLLLTPPSSSYQRLTGIRLCLSTDNINPISDLDPNEPINSLDLSEPIIVLVDQIVVDKTYECPELESANLCIQVVNYYPLQLAITDKLDSPVSINNSQPSLTSISFKLGNFSASLLSNHHLCQSSETVVNSLLDDEFVRLTAKGLEIRSFAYSFTPNCDHHQLDVELDICDLELRNLAANCNYNTCYDFPDVLSLSSPSRAHTFCRMRRLAPSTQSSNYSLHLYPPASSASIEDTLVLHLTRRFTELYHPWLITSNTLSRDTIRFVHINALDIEPLSLHVSLRVNTSFYLSLHDAPMKLAPFNLGQAVDNGSSSSSCLISLDLLHRLLLIHYTTHAVMSTGWMLGSLDLIGNWTGLLKSLAVGIGDFVHLRSSHSTSDRQALTSTDYHHRGTSTIIPVQTGIDRTVSIVSGDQTSSAIHPISAATQSPYKSVLILNALYGFSGGLRSLVDRTTDGFIRSVTGMALSLARNLDHLSLDDRHRLRQDASRRANQPQSIGQGVNRGLASFSLCLLGALAGLANQPLEPLFASMADDTATPSRWTSVGAGMLKGAGRGILGAIVKPASGAADLVAQTGLGWVNKRRRSIDTLAGNHPMLDTVTRSFGPLDAIDKQLLLTITSKCIDMTLRRSLAIAGADWIVLGLLRESDSSIRPVLVHLCPDSNNMTLSVIDISTDAVNCTQTSLTPIEPTCTSTASLKFRRSVNPEATLELELGSFDGALVKEFISINDSVKIDLLLPSDAATVSSQLPSKDHVTSERLLSTTSTWSRVKAYLKSSTTNNQTLDV